MNTTARKLTDSRAGQIVSLILDVVSVSYFFWSSFFLEEPLITFELALGIYFLLEFFVLLLASKSKWAYIRHPLAISNVLVILGYLAAPFWNVGFLRIFRSFRVLQFYQIIPDLRMLTKKIIFWERLAIMLTHFTVLIFIITEIVFFTQQEINDEITTRFDAFYFTTHALAKIGNGESIELVGVQGQILTLLIAFLSLSIFVQLMDTAHDYRRNKKKVNEDAEDFDPEEVYSEQMCKFCDIKERHRYLKK